MQPGIKNTASEEPQALLTLRGSTRNEQKRVEILMGLGKSVDLDRYGGLLVAMTLFLEAWEPRVVQAMPPAWRVWFVCRRRSVLLRRDLNALSLSVSPRKPLLKIDLATPSAAWGSLYAIEGLTMRNQEIAARLHEAHGIGAHNGGAYFGARGDVTGTLWRESSKVIQSMLEGPKSQAEACAAAVQTFHALTKVFLDVPTKQFAAAYN
ncbi:MAG: biliverdin-producing heme oxygenase [Polaromonas sp.]|uniref:biliverdin-producing heme oxygenase n=1 Tax=Polaromonas sp. TaxID=1869339 RepID=UPI0024879CDB|nr:biliverdin-producing heme oxygenase [Polaromonas sp.]MDI1237285.1 biliverdin-producing heme oxygenase [Polaromonas sp.]